MRLNPLCPGPISPGPGGGGCSVGELRKSLSKTICPGPERLAAHREGRYIAGYYVVDSRAEMGEARLHVGQATRVTHDLLRFWEFALHGRGCRGYPACSLNQEGRDSLSFPPALIHCSEYLSGTPTSSVDFYAPRGRERPRTPRSDLGYTGSRMRTSENASSTHSGE
jgi:hypothetical protein